MPNSCCIPHILNRFVIDSLTFVQHALMLFSNRSEFLRDSSRIEPFPPNIRNDIVSESGMTRSSSRLEKKKLMKPDESPRLRKKSIRGDSGDSRPVWNRGIIPLFHTGHESPELPLYPYSTQATNRPNCHDFFFRGDS